MKFIKPYAPIIAMMVVLIMMASAQALLRQSPEPEILQSQVGEIGNSLQEITSLELEIELVGGKEIKMDYRGRNQQLAVIDRDDRTDGSVSGDDALEQMETLVGSLPPLTTEEPLALIQSVLDQLEIHQADVKDFELEYRLEDGTDRQIELEVEREGDDEDDND